MILLNLDRASKKPLFLQVFYQLKQLIDDNTLKPGFRMPSTRLMAEKHGLNRSTVYKAYQELWALGYTESRPGSYSVVRKRQRTAGDGVRAAKGLISWEHKSSPSGRIIYQTYRNMKTMFPIQEARSKLIDMSSLNIDKRLFPVDEFRKCVNAVIIEQGGRIFEYGDTFGYFPLREYIAQRMRIHGIIVEPEEILITNGSQNGLELILKMLTEPDSRVVVESPTYSCMLPLLEYYKNRILEIPMEPGGMNLEKLAEALKTHSPALLYTIPNFHNPTGITTGQKHREKLLALCEKHCVPIVEDAFEEEMKYFGKVPLPIKSMDRNHLVMYVGTFSKVLAPGIRVGWVAAEKESIQRLAAIKKYSDLSTNSLSQTALHEFCRQGYYDRHVKRMHKEYRKRMNAAINALRERVAPLTKVTWNEPAGGYLLWLHLDNTGVDMECLNEIFAHNGVAVAHGKYFYPHSSRYGHDKKQRGDCHSIRLSIATLDVSEIQEGIRRLADALVQVYRTRQV